LDHSHGRQNCIQWCPAVYHNSLVGIVLKELLLPNGDSVNRKYNIQLSLTRYSWYFFFCGLFYDNVSIQIKQGLTIG
jgi:hypothetical protein